jgi:thiol-disulfide isomerase/thioredoxin
MSSGVVVLVVAVVLAVAFGLWRAATDGRFRGTHQVRGAGVSGSGGEPVETEAEPVETPAVAVVAAAGGTLGERATLLQFSSAFCAPCRATRRVLAGVATTVEGVTHVEVDAEHHLEATRELGVMRTPTTIVLDAAGREVTRATGAPTTDQVLAAVALAVP